MERTEVHLVAQVCPERVDRPLGIDACPVEAPVNGTLDTGTEWLEQRCGDEGGCRDREGVLVRHRREQRLEPDDRPGEHGHQQAGDERPPDRPAHDPIDLVQAVPEDRDVDGGWHERVGHDRGDPGERPDVLAEHEEGAQAEGDRDDHEGERGDEPAELEAHDADGPSVADDQ